jgi:hypothetical protein
LAATSQSTSLLPYPSPIIERGAYDVPAEVRGPDAHDDTKFPTLAEHWGARGLVQDILDNRRPLLRCADAGLGDWLDSVLGGGLAQGETLAVGAAGAGIGKTALVHQLADGWADWSARNLAGAAGSGRRASVVPVLYVTEMGVRTLSIRSMARLAEVPGNLLRAPAHYGQRGTEAAQKAAAISGKLCAMGEFITPVDRTVHVDSGVSAVGTLGRQLERIREKWSATADITAAVLVLDPVHRLLDASKDETGGLSEVLGALLSLTQSAGLVTILTSDTTKSAASTRNGTGAPSDKPEVDDLEAQAEQAFRGSYQLMHVPDHVVMLRALDPKPGQPGGQPARDKIAASPVGPAFNAGRGTMRDEWATVFADLPSPKLRWGKVGDRPSYFYDRALFRFTPIAQPGMVLPARATGPLDMLPVARPRR